MQTTCFCRPLMAVTRLPTYECMARQVLLLLHINRKKEIKKNFLKTFPIIEPASSFRATICIFPLMKLWTIVMKVHTNTNITIVHNFIKGKIQMGARNRVTLTHPVKGLWWWSSGQSFRLLLRRSEFESHLSLHVFL